MKNIAVYLFVVVSVLGQTKKPEWVDKRPTDTLYYIGIGIAAKSGTPQEYQQKAKDGALNDIAQQIVVSVDAEQLSTLAERMGNVTSEFQTAVKTSTKADLEDVETVDSWSGDESYWVYERVSIAEYKKKRAEKIRKATSLSLDFFQKGKTSERSGNLSEALQSYVQSLSVTDKYLGEAIETEYEGNKIFLSNEIFSSIQSLLNQIQLVAKNSRLDGQVGKPISSALEVSVMISNGNRPVNHMPLRYKFIKGSGEIVSPSRSGKDGIASTQITKITGTDKLQLVKVEVDLSSFMPQNSTVLLETLLKSFSVPFARFTVNVSSLSIAFETDEMLLGTKLALPRIEPLLKNSLSSQGYSFVDDPSKAAMMVNIKSNGRDGGSYNGLYTVYVDANISVLDLNSGEEVYKTAFNNIKGVSISSEKAGMKAYDEIAEKLQKIEIPKILEELKK